MTDVRIRPTRPNDAESIRSVAADGWTDVYDGILDDETIDRKLEEWYDPDDLAESAERTDGVFLVAVEQSSSSSRSAPSRENAEASDGVVGFAQSGPIPGADDADADGADADDTDADGADGADGEGAYVLSRIYVRPCRWGEGVGTRLLDQVLGAIRRDGAETLRVAVHADNDVGVGFYEARGFERVRERSTDLGDEYVYVREV